MGIKVKPSSNVLPTGLELIVNDLTSDVPAHMPVPWCILALYQLRSNAAIIILVNLGLILFVTNLPSNENKVPLTPPKKYS